MTDERRDAESGERPGQTGRPYSEEEVLERLAAFALGALEPDEMLAVERYLETHPALEQHLRSLESSVASLAHAAPRAPLPARVKEQLMRRVRNDQAPVLVRNPLVAVAAPSSPPARPTGRGMRPIPRPPAKAAPPATSPWGVFFRAFAAAGALATILLLAGIAWQLRTQLDQLSTQLSTAQLQIAQLQTDNQQLQTSNADLQAQMKTLVERDFVFNRPQQLIALAHTPDGPLNASGFFVRRDDAAVLVLRGLPTLPNDQTYQLWILPPNGPALPADLLTVADPESNTFQIAIRPEQSDLAGVGVSIEPQGGSQTPTTVVLLGKLDGQA
jgi:anti-sigma-K factor RskA/outer membrane murein-binding lipoprotein Lpp